MEESNKLNLYQKESCINPEGRKEMCSPEGLTAVLVPSNFAAEPSRPKRDLVKPGISIIGF